MLHFRKFCQAELVEAGFLSVKPAFDKLRLTVLFKIGWNTGK